MKPLTIALCCAALSVAGQAAVIAVDTGPGVSLHTTWESFNQDVVPTVDAPSVTWELGIDSLAVEIGGAFDYAFVLTNNGEDGFSFNVTGEAAKIENVPFILRDSAPGTIPAAVIARPKLE